jgi:OmcA/MtrC family decaheme c-type cytochrome
MNQERSITEARRKQAATWAVWATVAMTVLPLWSQVVKPIQGESELINPIGRTAGSIPVISGGGRTRGSYINNYGFPPTSKSYYLDQAQVNFVRPGLLLMVTGASFASDGTITATLTVTDNVGLPLDIHGVYTPGPVSISFSVATIPNGQEQYVSYIYSTTSTGYTQPGSDSTGVFTETAPGAYTYTFAHKVPATFDPTATQTVAAWASRNLTSFNLGTQYSNSVYNWVPNGSKVTHIRDVVETQSCNQCHDPLSAHGGSRQLVTVCVTCHTPQNSDANGVPLDLKVMIHKIHMGSSLPSVLAGGTYSIVGYMGSINNFSTVIFPSDVRDCTKCHTPTATQATAYLQPERAACGSCHDNVNFATGANHPGGIQTDDTKCALCHIPQGTQEFDASIIGAHTIPTNSTQLHGVQFKILSASGGPGTPVTVNFTVANKNDNPLALSALTSLSVIFAGPNTDYPSEITESALKAAGSNGNFTYVTTNKLPATASGSFTVGIEGYSTETINEGSAGNVAVRDAGLNQDFPFSVDGSPVVARQVVVELANCNSCHTQLSAHGGIRNEVTHCPLCHNPNGTDVSERPTNQNPPQSINFRTLVHKIHSGINLTNPYVIYGYGGSVNNFNGILFPGNLADCAKCHVNNSDLLPLPAGMLPVVTPRDYLNPTQPITASCVSCHDSEPVSSHALANTTILGESCIVCHGEGAAFAVDFVHAQ